MHIFIDTALLGTLSMDPINTNINETTEASEAMLTEALEEGVGKTLTSTESIGRCNCM